MTRSTTTETNTPIPPPDHPAPPPTRFIGCDVGKASIVVFDSATNTSQTIANRTPDLRRLAGRLDATCLVICEATGGYEAKLLKLVSAAGHAIHRADARKVKNFIRSFGTLAKSDTLDARALARYGAERHAQLARWTEPDPARTELAALVGARADLLAARQKLRNQIQAPGRAAAAILRPVLRQIDAQLRAVNAQIIGRIARHPRLLRDSQILRTIPGIGAVTAAILLALMPELGRLGANATAALAGVAPHPNQSGEREGYRKTRGGRPDVKRALFMAALAAQRSHSALADFANRLRQRGKKPMVALTALMRKIIVIANARIRDAENITRIQQVS